jgi:hypothetical protein
MRLLLQMLSAQGSRILKLKCAPGHHTASFRSVSSSIWFCRAQQWAVTKHLVVLTLAGGMPKRRDDITGVLL